MVVHQKLPYTLQNSRDHDKTNHFCISSSTASVVVNGRKGDEFTPTRGLRQGDPMSPYVFILCMEYLSHLITSEVQNGNWNPISPPRGGIKLSHVFFADDLLIFGVNDHQTLLAIARTFQIFSTLSGLQINFSKSKLVFSANSTPILRQQACAALNIEEAPTLGTYLGFPIKSGSLNKTDLSFILDKVHSKLAAWKTSFLSPMGKTILIKVTLQSIPAYWMQIVKFPTSICNAIDKACRDFLWQKSGTETNFHLVNWNRCCQPKRRGGLGLRRAKGINKCFQIKLAWRFLHGKGSPWVDFLMRRHERAAEPHLNITCSSAASPLWKFVSTALPFIAGQVHWNVNNGVQVNLLHDVWFSKSSIRSIVSGPIRQEEENLSLRPFITGQADIANLSLELPHHLKTSFYCTISIAQPTISDSFHWPLTPNGCFTVASVYEALLSKEPFRDLSFLWKLRTLPKITFFCWTLLLDANSCRTNLAHRGMEI